MTQRVSLILAAVVTGFLLVAVGAVGGRVVTANASGGAAAAAPAADLVSVMQQRDAAYRQMIDQANSRLLQAQAASQPEQPALPTYPVTADQAAARAIAFAGGTLVQPPQLVDVQGTIAYEVVLTGGTFYVNATTSGILMNNVPTITISTSSGGGYEDEHEGHEGGDD
jgi:hypothetical protein